MELRHREWSQAPLQVHLGGVIKRINFGTIWETNMKHKIVFGYGDAPEEFDFKELDFYELRRHGEFTDFYDIHGNLVYSLASRRIASIERLSE